MSRAVVVILDSFGLGATPDAPRFGDVGADTLGHIAQWCAARGRPLRLPHLSQLGLPQAAFAASGRWPIGLERIEAPQGAFGAAREISLGKDTPSGHWELMGCPVAFDWGYFAKSDDPGVPVFPPALMQRWYAACGLEGSLGNRHASGTEILDRLGDEHVRTGWPICYTSSDSVFQVAAHEELFGLARLYDICEVAKSLFDEINIARVIARPFVGAQGQYRRTAGRHDYTTPPPLPTLLDVLVSAGREVHGVGKIRDIFANRGITHHRSGDGNEALCEQTLAALDACPDGGLVFANLVDFDMLYGHRRDVAGYADALEAFDAFLPTLVARLRPGDLLALSADHGCDPTWPGSDHTREHAPLLFAGPASPVALDLGVRDSFADLGQTLAAHLELPRLSHGRACWRRDGVARVSVMKRVLVTGSSGRIGRAVCECLRAEHEVISLDRLPSAATNLVGDIGDPDLLRRALRGVDAVVHVAALHAPHVGTVADAEFDRVNVQATRRLAELAAEAGASEFVFTSTTALYGAASRPDRAAAAWIDEALEPRPQTVYHRSKLAAEALLQTLAEQRALAITVLRMSRCFPEAAPLMASYRLHRGVDARDVARAHALALQTPPRSGFRRFVVSAATPFKPDDVEELARDAPSLLRRRAPELVEAFARRGWRLPATIDRVVSPALAMRDLGWRPLHGFDDVLKMLDENSAEVLPPRRDDRIPG